MAVGGRTIGTQGSKRNSPISISPPKWEEGKIRWLLDGEVWQEQSRWESEEAPFPAPFDQHFHLVLNLAIGGGFVGDPASHTPFPSQYLVDWVRVYQARSQP